MEDLSVAGGAIAGITQQISNVNNTIDTGSTDIVNLVNSFLKTLPYGMGEKLQVIFLICGICTIIASCLPPPQSKMYESSFRNFILSSKIYLFIYKIINFLGVNLGQARNFAHPAQRIIINKLLEITNNIKPSDNHTESVTSKIESIEEIQKPEEFTVVAFNKDGTPIISNDNGKSFINFKKKPNVKKAKGNSDFIVETITTDTTEPQ